jgi:hypothetical protein
MEVDEDGKEEATFVDGNVAEDAPAEEPEADQTPADPMCKPPS